MAGTFQIAWRNLGRNRRRSLITGVALAAGMALCVASYGWTDGLNAEILHALTRFDLGHVEVHQPDYPRNHKLERTIDDPARVIAAARTLRGVRGVSARAYGFGLASAGTSSAGVQLVGVEPDQEPGVTELEKQIVAGRYLESKPTPWPEGRPLSAEERARDEALTRRAEAEALAEIESLGAAPRGQPGAPASGRDQQRQARQAREQTRTLAARLEPPPERPPRVILGADLARILKVGLGGTVYIISRTVDGLNAETSFRVIGIYSTGTSFYDRGRIYLNLHDLERFLHLDHRVHEIAILGPSADDAPELAAELRARLGGEQLLVRPWQTIRPDIKNMVDLNRASMVIMVAIIFLVAALGVVNTMLMAVFERTRELGMLKAIGLSGWRILGLIVVETMLLVLCASLFGTALGLGLDLYLMFKGINLGATGSISLGGMGISPTIHAAITTEGFIVPVLVLALMCFLGALYPASRAARMQPAQGMREV